jgi:GTP pyrophosphokinase
METVAQKPKYNLNDEQEKKLILREYRALLRSLKTRIKPGDRKLIRTAFEMAADAHKSMRRKSGEPYILHPLAVATICTEEIGFRAYVCNLFSSCMTPLKTPTFHLKIFNVSLVLR